MLSQPDDTQEPSMVEYLIGYLLQNGSLTEENLRTFHPSVCNRLDKNTSGVISVPAKSRRYCRSVNVIS